MLKKTTSIKRKKINTKYTKKYSNNKKKSSKNIFKILLYIILFFLIFCFVLMLILYNKYIKDLPSVSELENYNLAESSIIYDRNGKILNSIFKEKRTYVSYNNISKNMVNAIVAGEDKKFWTNPGIDIVGLARAGLNFATGKSDTIGGTSTLTQQLIRNTLIEKKKNEKLWEGIERKVKELYLAFSLTKNGVSKEKILELYLNKIDYGHNSFGIEEASKTFFNKKSKDLNILEASILASIPKGPTFYSPYNHKDRLVGNAIIYNKKGNEENKIDIITKKQIDNNIQAIKLLKETFNNLKGKNKKGSDILPICGIKKENFSSKFKVDSDGCVFLTYSELNVFLGSIKVKFGDKIVGYDIGRKDYILRRMLEDSYINFDQFKNAIIDSINITFNQNRENIKAPHFVFYIREYLEEKYGKDTLAMGGLKIYTTLDYDAQLKAEEIVKKQAKINSSKFNAKNAGLISIDNTNGDIIAMVGSADYYNEDIKGNVNVITSKMQPGSTFKPFVYSIAMFEKEIGTETPIYDLKTDFGGYKPNNFDGKFMGKISISKALNYSRNIPAVKMYYLAGGKENIVKFMKRLGVKSLSEKGNYGASLALGSGEMTPLELAKAYTVFANMGKKVEINPILKIIDSKGNPIEERKEIKKNDVISSGQAFIINSILSDTSQRPTFWNKYMSLSDRKVSAKTGTSTKPIKDKYGKRIEYPANLWTVGYTPQITTVAWAGNSDGETLNYKGSGLEGAGPIWRNFMEYIHKGKKPLKWVKPDDIKSVNISEITGYLPNPENINTKNLISSYFINIPKKIDNSYQTIKYDALCNGIITEKTPKAAIRKATVLEFHSLQPDNPNWENPVLFWAKSEEAIKKYGSSEGLLGNISDKVCERDEKPGKIIIKSNIDEKLSYSPGSNYVEIAYQSDNPIIKIEILIDNILIKTYDINGKNSGALIENLFISGGYKNKKIKLEIRALDKNYYSNSEIKNLVIMEDIYPPIINMINPVDGDIKIYEDEYFNFKANIKDSSPLKFINIYIDSKLYKSFKEQRNINIPINSIKKYNIGSHNIKLEVSDKNSNISEKTIKFDILSR